MHSLGESGRWFYCQEVAEDKRVGKKMRKVSAMSGYADAPRDLAGVITAAKSSSNEPCVRGDTSRERQPVSRFIVSAFLK